MTDEFYLCDLKVEVMQDKNKIACSHEIGSFSEMYGENIIFSGKKEYSSYAFYHYCQQSSVKLIQITGRPQILLDPNCGGIVRVIRIGKENLNIVI